MAGINRVDGGAGNTQVAQNGGDVLREIQNDKIQNPGRDNGDWKGPTNLPGGKIPGNSPNSAPQRPVKPKKSPPPQNTQPQNQPRNVPGREPHIHDREETAPRNTFPRGALAQLPGPASSNADRILRDFNKTKPESSDSSSSFLRRALDTVLPGTGSIKINGQPLKRVEVDYESGPKKSGSAESNADRILKDFKETKPASAESSSSTRKNWLDVMIEIPFPGSSVSAPNGTQHQVGGDKMSPILGPHEGPRHRSPDKQ